MAKLLRERPSVVLQKNRQRVLDLIAQYGGSDVRVFGSVASGDDTPDSDVDLIVRFAPGSIGFTKLIALEDELSAALGVPVDVISAGSERIQIVSRDAVAL